MVFSRKTSRSINDHDVIRRIKLPQAGQLTTQIFTRIL